MCEGCVFERAPEGFTGIVVSESPDVEFPIALSMIQPAIALGDPNDTRGKVTLVAGRRDHFPALRGCFYRMPPTEARTTAKALLEAADIAEGKTS